MMAHKGPKPKPTQLRVIEGDPNKARYNLSEPEFGAFDMADIPARVVRDPEALALWQFLAPKLTEAGILQDADRPALEMLCVHYAMWTLKPSMQMGKGVMSMLAEFGLTPSSRSRIIGKPKGKPTPLETLLKPRSG